jgi:uncharacterized membrane protein YpjA
MVLLGLFAVAAYFIVTDESVAAAFYYVTKLVKVYTQRQWWWLTNNPRNPVVKYLIWRKSMKLAKELEQKIIENMKNDARD